MSTRKKFRAIDNAVADSYAVELDRNARAFGVLEHHAEYVPPIWTWRVTVDDRPFANGATFSLPRAKAAVLFAWKGYTASQQSLGDPKPALKRRRSPR
jgi:hypothetical protein